MAQLEMITDRQRAVLDLVVQHWTSKEIARELGISPNTVDQRINAVRTKLGARDRAETARLYAELNGIFIASVAIRGPFRNCFRSSHSSISCRGEWKSC
ncbi:helix-turn-helix transcriptional regulator [Novosphingobium sp. APW14]|uniref:response regulator transcription factor n=1 Tax=Novosphingobium sp. APW14 TaxID=3077237 RepID=UPI0028DF2A44|nr:helix-turn-helix transcriptional regulator [Novosphingobium sp. APW14]MDT9012928.1 helix-turn-helix transcriptional regulator [Novosphingobium sp. APW14]